MRCGLFIYAEDGDSLIDVSEVEQILNALEFREVHLDAYKFLDYLEMHEEFKTVATALNRGKGHRTLAMLYHGMTKNQVVNYRELSFACCTRYHQIEPEYRRLQHIYLDDPDLLYEEIVALRKSLQTVRIRIVRLYFRRLLTCIENPRNEIRASPLSKKYQAVLLDQLDCLEIMGSKSYGGVVATFLPACEMVIMKIGGKLKVKSDTVCGALEEIITNLRCTLVEKWRVDYLETVAKIAYSNFGKHENPDHYASCSQNAILHGADSRYAIKANVINAIELFRFLSSLYSSL